MSNIAERIAKLSPDKRSMMERLLKSEHVDLSQKIILPQSRERNYFPLSYSQQRLWFLDQLEPNRPYYTISIVRRLRGAFDLAIFERAVTEIVRRHESLRTTFRVIDQVPMQVIGNPDPFKASLLDLSNLPRPERRAQAKYLAWEDSKRPFVLSEGPLFRVTLLRMAERDHVMLLMMHHAVSEGWSVEIFFRELTTLYNAFLAGEDSPLPELPVQYADFAVWQRNWLEGPVLENQLSYWKNQLADAPAMLELPLAQRRPPQQSFNGKIAFFMLPAELSAQLKQLCQNEGVTIFMLLLASFQALLWRYTNEPVIVVGTAIAGRHRREIQPLIGFFVNMLALRARFTEQQTFRELLMQVKEVCLGAYDNQDVPLEKLVEEMQPARSLSHQPIFQILFELEEAPSAAMNHRRFGAGDIAGLSMSDFAYDGYCAAMFDLGVTMIDTAQGLGAKFRYKTDLFNDDSIARLFDHFQVLLREIVNNPDELVRALPMLDAAERRQLLHDWNETPASGSADQSLKQLFEAQAERTPDLTAVIFESQRLNYRELNARANRLARLLQHQGVGPEVLVAVCLRRSPELIVTLLAVCKAGGAFLPLDAALPSERLARMLEHSGAPVLITDSDLADALPAHAGYTLCLDQEAQRLAVESDEPPVSFLLPDNLAYVIYTSGSTGQPKGVMISHRSLVNYLNWAVQAYDLKEGALMPVHTSIGFDLTITSLFAPLLAGCALHLLPETNQLEVLANTLCGGADYSLVKLTPAHLRLLREQLRGKKVAAAATNYVVGGENLLWSNVSWCFDQSLTSRIFNEYGPTEATVGCCVYQTAGAEAEDGSVPIGKPIANTSLYVLDARLEPVPIGVKGELFIGGAGLSRGYLRLPGLTAEKFIPNPHSELPGERLYRTGDVVRWRSDGNLEFCERIDQQVKIRGYRIELTEIESALNNNPEIKQVVVCAREAGDDLKLVAYYTSDAAQLTASALREYVRRKLPEYMIPAHFVRLPALPVTAGGKIDAQALPDLSEPDSDLQTFVPASNALEVTLAEIWCEVLQLQRVGINDDFFELGGHSLLATSLISRLRDALAVDLSVHSLFERPTIRLLALLIDEMLIKQMEDLSEDTAQELLRAES